MKRLLRNSRRSHISHWFRGRKITFRSKAARYFDMKDEEEAAEYRHWLKIYGGLIYDDTPEEVKRGEVKP